MRWSRGVPGRWRYGSAFRARPHRRSVRTRGRGGGIAGPLAEGTTQERQDWTLPVIPAITISAFVVGGELLIIAIAGIAVIAATRPGGSRDAKHGYGNIAPELLLDLLAAGKAGDWKAARAAHDRMLPITKAVYHRGSHMEGTVALKIALRTRGVLPNAVVRSPLVDLTPEAEQEIADAMKTAGLA